MDLKIAGCLENISCDFKIPDGQHVNVEIEYLNPL